MATATQQPQMGLSFEQVWAALMENRDVQRETDRIVRENAEQQKKQTNRYGKLKKLSSKWRQELIKHR